MKALKFSSLGTALFCIVFLSVNAEAVIGQNGKTLPAQPKDLPDALMKAGPADKIPIGVTFRSAPKEADYAMLERAINFKPRFRYSIIHGAAGELILGQINALSRMDIVDRVEQKGRIQ